MSFAPRTANPTVGKEVEKASASFEQATVTISSELREELRRVQEPARAPVQGGPSSIDPREPARYGPVTRPESPSGLPSSALETERPYFPVKFPSSPSTGQRDPSGRVNPEDRYQQIKLPEERREIEAPDDRYQRIIFEKNKS